MKKYTKPSVEIEKFTVADIITDSTPNIDTDIGELSNGGVDVSAGLEVGDEF